MKICINYLLTKIQTTKAIYQCCYFSICFLIAPLTYPNLDFLSSQLQTLHFQICCRAINRALY